MKDWIDAWPGSWLETLTFLLCKIPPDLIPSRDQRMHFQLPTGLFVTLIISKEEETHGNPSSNDIKAN